LAGSTFGARLKLCAVGGICTCALQQLLGGEILNATGPLKPRRLVVIRRDCFGLHVLALWLKGDENAYCGDMAHSSGILSAI